jgi:RHS repeat-associated protein
MKKMVHPRPLSGMNDFMEWSHASLDHVRWCSSRKRAVEGSPSSQPSVNFVPSVVQCDPQGNPPSVDNLFSIDPYANRFLYTGREFLKEANLYDYRNRVYSTELGRFLQTDPIRFHAGDVNLYRYVSNDPVNWVDALGLDRTPYFFGHAWIEVDTWDKNCCKTGRITLDLAPDILFGAGDSDWRIGDASNVPYPRWFSITIKSSCEEDKQLLSDWETMRDHSNTRWNGYPFNCVRAACAFFRSGMQQSPQSPQQSPTSKPYWGVR